MAPKIDPAADIQGPIRRWRVFGPALARVTTMTMTDMKKATADVTVVSWMPTGYFRMCMAPPKIVRTERRMMVMWMTT